MRQLTKEDIDAIQSIQWAHCMPIGYGACGELITEGALKHEISRFATERFGLPSDLTGKTVLDIGAWDGGFSFESERRGASLVVASDIACSQEKNGNWGANKGFNLAHRLLDSKVKFLESSVYDLPYKLRAASLPIEFDVVLFYGVFYHLIDVLGAFQKVQEVTSGTAIIEGAIAYTKGNLMEFRPGYDGDPTNFWYPTVECLKSMLLQVGFSSSELFHEFETSRATVIAKV